MNILKTTFNFYNNIGNIYNPSIIHKENISCANNEHKYRTMTLPGYDETVSFRASVIFENNTYEKTYSRNFFRKILQEGVPCAYTGVKMIPGSDIDDKIHAQVFRKKSSFAIKYLKEYKDQMFDIERRVYDMLEKESKKHPDLKLQELLKLKYSMAEKTLIRQQSAVLDHISLMSRAMPKQDHQQVRKLINEAFDKIFEQDPLPENRFKRKEFIYNLRELKLTNKSIHDKILKEAEKLPQSSTSFQAFIVKYAQPYKIKYIDKDNIVKIPRDSDELALRLLKPSTGTDEHIYPQELYRKEEIARQNGDADAKKLSDTKVTILTTDYINAQKGNMLLDDFISKSKYDIKGNIQKHIDRLIEIDHKWLDEGRIEDANRLADYILLLKEEFQRRSNIVDINIEEFKKEIPEIKSKTQTLKEKIEQKRLKKCGHADNSHGEVYLDSDGQPMENRKIHIHSSRFKK